MIRATFENNFSDVLQDPTLVNVVSQLVSRWRIMPQYARSRNNRDNKCNLNQFFSDFWMINKREREPLCQLINIKLINNIN